MYLMISGMAELLHDINSLLHFTMTTLQQNCDFIKYQNKISGKLERLQPMTLY